MRFVLKGSLFLLIASILMMFVFLFRVQPSMRIWEQYKVIYFPAQCSDDEICASINDDNLLNLIVFGNTDYRHAWKSLISSGNEPIESRNFSMKEIRDFFFYDKSGEYKIIYVPDDIATDVINRLKKNSVSFGTDSVAQYPYLYPILCFAVLVLLMIVGRIPFIHTVCAVPLVLFSLWCPLYSSATGVICVLFALYTAEQYSGRKHSISKALLNPAIIICFLVSVFSIATSGINLTILFLLSIGSCISLWVSIKNIESLSISNCHFRYVPILTSRNIQPFRRVTIIAVSSLAVAAIVMTVFFFISSGVIKSVEKNGLYLPAPSEYTENQGINVSSYSELKDLRTKEQDIAIDSDLADSPDMVDFIDEYWLNIRSPYIRLADDSSYYEIEPGDTISIPVFTEDAEGIHASQKIIETFDDDFLERISEAFYQNGGAERFLSSHEKLFTTKYVKAGDTSHDITSVLAIISLFVLFVILLILKLIKGCKK